jgi:Gliding motility associated protein GldN
MMKLKNLVLTILVLFTVSATFAQTKKKSTAKKKPGVTVQKPADSPVSPPETAVTKPTVTPPVAVPMAEREQVIIPEQPVANNTKKQPNVNSAAERVITDSLSVHPIDPSNVLYRITNWRRMDLKEKINQPFFSKNNEITKFLIDGVKSGVLTAYTNDSVSTVLSMEAFTKNMQMEDTGGDALSDEEKKAGFGDAAAADDGWGNAKPSSTTPAKKGATPAAGAVDDGWGGTTPAKGTTAAKGAPATSQPASNGFGNSGTVAAEYFSRDLTILNIKEDYIFDKQRSRAYNSIQTITIIIPAEKTVKGFDVEVASFRYKDLDQYFRSNPKCVWYNFQNIAQHKNMADAFDLRLFNARIIKQSNPGDQYLVDLYKGEKAGLRASEQLEYKLMEFEHNLWEY